MTYLTAPAGLPIEQISGTQTVAVDFASEIVGEGFSKVITAGVALSAFATCNGSLFAGAQAVRESGCVVVQNWVAAWLCGCVVVWLCGCVVASLCGRVVVWSCGRAVAWLRSCVVAWLRPCVVWSCGCVAACCAWLPPSPLSPPLPPFTSLVVFRIFRLLTPICRSSCCSRSRILPKLFASQLQICQCVHRLPMLAWFASQPQMCQCVHRLPMLAWFASQPQICQCVLPLLAVIVITRAIITSRCPTSKEGRS